MKKPIKSLFTMLLVISLLMSNIAMFAGYAAGSSEANVNSNVIYVNDNAFAVNSPNNVYDFSNYNIGEFNYYKMTYLSDAYVRGIMTYSDGATEEFFLEPSDNFESKIGSFSSYIDGYLHKVVNNLVTTNVTTTTHNGIKSISFEPLDKESGNFQLLSFNTEKKSVNPSKYMSSNLADKLEFFDNGDYKVGVDILNGGVISYLEVLNSDIVSRVYETTDADTNVRNITRVDYRNKLDAAYGTGYKAQNEHVNLINYADNGRYLQQSYYGTDGTSGDGYIPGSYNNNDKWNYNPVQGGNVANEASKVIDYEINEAENYIYVKVRPLDWAKSSTSFPDDYITDTYVEAKYVFENGLIKTSCRMVDYSGYTATTRHQELPAFYTIEPLNHFVYNDVAADKAWKTKNLLNIEEPDFWGSSDTYKTNHNVPSPYINCYENWAAFTASSDEDSFGIGLYSPGITNFLSGVFPAKFVGDDANAALNYRHTGTVDPAGESPTSYIAPVGTNTFQSYVPTEYSYYISTGTVDQIRESFGVASNVASDENNMAEYEEGIIVVPETIYMTPSAGESKTGQYYVNNTINENGSVTLEAKNNNTNGYVQFYIPGAVDVSIAVNTKTNGIGDIVLNEASNVSSGELTGSYENIQYGALIDENGYFEYNTAGLYINGTGLKAGQTALAEWVFTITMDDGSEKTYYAYSTLYAPNYHSVGASAETRRNDSYRADGAGWISGVHDVTTTLAPFGKDEVDGADKEGVFKDEPLLNLETPMKPQEWKGTYNLTDSPDNKKYAREYYKMNDGGTNMKSPLGILYVDWSRNKNTNSIPNLYVGAEILRADNTGNDSQCHFYSYYTLGTGIEFINPGNDQNPYDSKLNWTEMLHIMANVNKNDNRSRYDATVASTLNKDTPLTSCNSIMNDANSGRSLRMYTVPNLQIKESGTQYIYSHTQIRDENTRYANMYTAVQLITVNKAELRDLVLQGTSLNEKDYNADTWRTLYSALKTAATALGNPTATADAVTTAKTTLEKAMNELKHDVVFDNLFNFNLFKDSIATSTITVNNVTDTGFTAIGLANTDGSHYNDCKSNWSYNISIKPNTTYVVYADVEHKAAGTAGYEIFAEIISSSITHLSDSTCVNNCDLQGGYVHAGSKNTFTFTSSPTAAYMRLRFDPNDTGSVMTVNNIRVYEAGTVADGVSYVAPISVDYGSTYGELPTPTRPGYDFAGWVDADKNPVTADTIMNSTETTVYLTSTWKDSINKAKNDTVVIEYGLPVKIDALSNDNITPNGKIEAIGKDEANCGSRELTLNNGKATLNADGTITYTLTNTEFEEEDVFYYEVDDNGLHYAKVTVIPATTLYYEDTFFTFTSEWETVGTSVTGVFQDMDRAGESNVADELNKAYGYDSSFDKQVTYSGGSAHYVEVDKSTGSNGPKATFTFTGTGFDLFSATNYNSGTLTVTIYSGTEVNSANRVKGIISNTYFGYKLNDSGEYEPADNGTIYQVPVIREHGLTYGTYTVVVEPRYSKAFDVTGADKYGVYVDSVRIYNPMGDNNQTANEAYMQDGEYAPQYLEIRDTLVTADTNGNFDIKEPEKNISVFLDGGSTLLKDYAMIGPKNEVYLAPGDAVAFNLVTDNGNLPSTIQIGMKLTGKGGNNASVALMKAFDSYWGETITLNSTTERYYNIKSVVEWEENNGTYKTKSPVVIFNTSSDAIISLTTIKWAFNTDIDSNSVTMLSLEADAQTPVMAMFAIRRVVDSDVQDDPQQTIPDTDNVEVVEPDVPDDKTDDITVDSDSGSDIMGIDSFITTLLTRLFNILKTVFDMLMGGVTA